MVFFENTESTKGFVFVATPTGTVNYDMLQRRIGKLEEENVQLRNEASLLAEQTDDIEQQEQKLVSDLVSQLSYVRSDLSSINDEAEKAREECREFKRLTENLTEKLQQTERKLVKVRKAFFLRALRRSFLGRRISSEIFGWCFRRKTKTKKRRRC